MCLGSQQGKKSMITVNVIGSSMEPHIKNGDLLHFKSVNKIDEIAEKDIVLCNHPYIKNLQIIKRVKKIVNGRFFVLRYLLPIQEPIGRKSCILLPNHRCN